MRISDWSSDVCSSDRFVLPLDGDVDWPAFTVWLSALLHCHGDRILRVKGKLYAASTGKPLIIHGVQHLMYPPVHLEAEPDDDRHSWLVFITSGLACHEITESLDRFLRHAPTAVVDLPGASVARHTPAAGPNRKSVCMGTGGSVRLATG